MSPRAARERTRNLANPDPSIVGSSRTNTCRRRLTALARASLPLSAAPDAQREKPRLREEPFTDRLSFMSNILITTSPEIMGGTPVFAGTRVPVQTLFEYLEAGDTIDDFLDGFPTVTREQVVAVLETAKARVLTEVK